MRFARMKQLRFTRCMVYRPVEDTHPFRSVSVLLAATVERVRRTVRWTLPSIERFLGLSGGVPTVYTPKAGFASFIDRRPSTFK